MCVLAVMKGWALMLDFSNSSGVEERMLWRTSMAASLSVWELSEARIVKLARIVGVMSLKFSSEYPVKSAKASGVCKLAGKAKRELEGAALRSCLFDGGSASFSMA